MTITKKITTIRLNVSLINKLKAEAEDQGRSLNNLIERILSEQIESSKAGN
jgi:predicted HicB family RNase H-like nuclease